MSIFRLALLPRFYLYYCIIILSLFTSARAVHRARHYIIAVQHVRRIYVYTDTFLLQIQPMHLRGVPIVFGSPGSHEKPVWGPEG